MKFDDLLIDDLEQEYLIKEPVKYEPHELFRRYKSCFEDKAKNYANSYGMNYSCDMDYRRMSRRMEAAFQTLETAREKIGEAYHDYPGAVNFTEDWMEFNSEIWTGYDKINNAFNLIAGAALWILDRLSENSSLQTVYENVLPELTEEDISSIPGMYEIRDFSYSRTLIAKVMYVLIHRNDDCKVYKQKKDIQRVFFDEATARNKQFQDVPSRNRFERLLSAIGDDAVKSAVQYYRMKYWDLARAYFDGLADVHKRIYDEMVKHDHDLDMLRNHMNSNFERVRSAVVEELLNSMDILAAHKAAEKSLTDAKDIADAMHHLENSIAAYKIIKRLSFDALPNYYNLSEKERFIRFPRRMNELLSDFEVEDPFAICFALLYLCDRDDDMAWNYSFGAPLVSMTAYRIPWIFEGDSFELDDYMRESEQHFGLLDDDLFKLKIAQPEMEGVDVNFVSFAQLFHKYTGYVLPRNRSVYAFANQEMNEYDLDDSEQMMMQLLMSLIQASLKRTEIDLIDETQDQTVEELSTKNADHLLKELNDKINSLKRENKSLRESAWREQKKAALLEEKIKAQNSAFEDDRNELARLREILFSMERKDEERPNSQISLPYENKTKIVICGGHDTFIKQIKTLLTGDVRYLNNVRINEDLIRSADVIWLQTNAISHSDYYKIINICRRNHIPYNYFLYASARKCAEQIFMEESKAIESDIVD